jgi:hypothetical protein
VPFVTKRATHNARYEIKCHKQGIVVCRHLQLLFVYLLSRRGTYVRLHNSVGSAWKPCDLHARLDCLSHIHLLLQEYKGGNTNLHGQLFGKCK